MGVLHIILTCIKFVTWLLFEYKQKSFNYFTKSGINLYYRSQFIHVLKLIVSRLCLYLFI